MHVCVCLMGECFRDKGQIWGDEEMACVMWSWQRINEKVKRNRCSWLLDPFWRTGSWPCSVTLIQKVVSAINCLWTAFTLESCSWIHIRPIKNVETAKGYSYHLYQVYPRSLHESPSVEHTSCSFELLKPGTLPYVTEQLIFAEYNAEHREKVTWVCQTVGGAHR